MTEEIDNRLLDWFRKARIKNMPITWPMLQEKAMEISQGLDISQDEFKVSNGWLDRFKSRNEIKAGEAGDVREETVDSWKERLPELLQGYAPENIWNMDETRQFFRALPNKCLSQASGNCTGGKRSKERLTCVFFVNASGDKENLSLFASQAILDALGESRIERHFHASTLVNPKPGWKVTSLLKF